MSDRDFYERIIDLIADWQWIVEVGSSEAIPDEAIAVLSVAARQIVQIAEETNPGDYHTEVFDIVQH